MTNKKIHLIRTYMSVGIGGPVPPLELLYVAAEIEKKLGDYYQLKITDTGIGELSQGDIKEEIASYNPDIICLNALAWEAHGLHTIAMIAKGWDKDVIVVVFGQLATLAKDYLCEDRNIDYVIVGEPELTMVELLGALENQGDLSGVNGLVYKINGITVVTKPRIFPEDLDSISISSSVWDLIDIKAYARYANWNGALKESFYMPILTSRGCPFPCTFCHETYDKQFRARSPGNIVSEIQFLKEKYNVREIHIFDAVFNYDNERAKQICNAIIDAGLDIHLAFPHGIRADIMTDELISLLKEAGTYKLVYGIETAVPRLQKMIKKNLNLSHVNGIIAKTTQTGILTGGYFMLGFPEETEEEMRQTIEFAVKSDLDIASFFKVTDYSDILKIYQVRLQKGDPKRNMFVDFEDISYFSTKRSQAVISAWGLNNVILQAQREFYLNPRRLWRGVKKYPSKRKYLKNVLTAVGLILQAYLLQELTTEHSHKRLGVESSSSKRK